MTDPLYSSTPPAPNLLLDLNLNMNLNPKTTVHDDMYNVKYRQTETLYKPLLFEPLKQLRVSHVMFKVTNVIYFGLYLKSFNSLEKYIRQLKNN